jgi:hypothetical protein
MSKTRYGLLESLQQAANMTVEKAHAPDIWEQSSPSFGNLGSFAFDTQQYQEILRRLSNVLFAPTIQMHVTDIESTV